MGGDNVRNKAKILVLLWTVALIISAVGFVNAQESEMSIVVQGTGDARVTPDMAYVWLGVQTENLNVAEALKESNSTVQDLLKVLENFAPKEHTKTSEFNIYRRERWDDRTQQSIADAFVVRHMFEVPVYNLDSVGEVVDKAIQAGANQVNGIQYAVQNSKSAQELAYQTAVEEAMWKAKILAKASGYTNIEVIKLEEANFFGPTFAAEGRAALSDTPSLFMPGQLKVSVTVNAHFKATR